MDRIQTSKFYIMFGISPNNTKRCAICIDQVPHDRLFLPQNDGKYVIHSIFEFSAARKSVHGAIVSALQNCGVIPDGGIVPRKNPDNKYYTKLPADDIETILTIIRRVVTGLDVIKKNGRVSSGYTEYSVPKALFEDICKHERPKQLLGTPGIINIGYSDITLHKF